MTAERFAVVFGVVLLVVTGLRLWLAFRQFHHVHRHRDAVPVQFAESISLSEHQRAADYAMARMRLILAETPVDAGLIALLTFGGLLQYIDTAARNLVGAGYLHGLLLFAASGLVGTVASLPFAAYRTFRLEARFGFNRTTVGLWLADLAREALLSAVIGAPLLLTVLWLAEMSGPNWWLYAWMVWTAFALGMTALYPTVIAPLFNRFTPLADQALKTRIEDLLLRCGFRSSGVFVMDGSKRSAHGNAYFSGFGKAKRIVFFDTLIEKLGPNEISAVLAHELGHFHHRHVLKRIGVTLLASLLLLWVLGQLSDQSWFYGGLGVASPGMAMALLLFMLVLPIFLFPLTPFMSALSRRHEYQADAYAAKATGATDLIRALVKLYRDNAATLTPDPLHSLFHDSHPPASLRVARLAAL